MKRTNLFAKLGLATMCAFGTVTPVLIRELFVVKKLKYNQNKCINRNINLTDYYSNYLLRFFIIVTVER